MRYISEIIVVLVTTTAAVTGEKVDTSVLKSCKHSEDCHPWQVCATCTAPIFWGFLGAHSTKGWCSDVSDTGLCDYDDGDLSCSCNKEEENDPKRKVLLNLGSEDPERFCTDDSFCRLYVANSRCSHCRFTTDIHEISVIMNMCTTAPEEDPNSYCHHSQLFMCSCGQRLPAPINQLRSPITQNKNPQQDVITAANPPDLTGAERVDLSAWEKQAVLRGGGGGSLPAAGLLASSWMQDIAGPVSGEEDIWTGDEYDSFNT